MRKFRTLLFVQLITFQICTLAYAEGLAFIGSKTIKLAGIFKLADIRLYSDWTATSEVLQPQNAIQLRIEYHRNISSNRLIKIARDALDEEHPEDINQRFSSFVEAINSSYVDVTKGDTYNLKYQPTNGLELSLNGEQLIHLKDDDFALYYLRIWLGTNRIATSTNPLIED